jgi:hypothetical protein
VQGHGPSPFTDQRLSLTSGGFHRHFAQVGDEPLAQLRGPVTQGLLQGLGVQVAAARTNQMADLMFQASAQSSIRQDGGEPDQVGPGRGLLEGPGTGVQVKQLNGAYVKVSGIKINGGTQENILGSAPFQLEVNTG